MIEGAQVSDNGPAVHPPGSGRGSTDARRVQGPRGEEGEDATWMFLVRVEVEKAYQVRFRGE